jgi:soluble lytic murein transglycosylase-like protein
MAGGRGYLPWVLFLAPLLVLAGTVKTVDDPHWTDEFDGVFRKYTKHYFGPGFDWRWFKAQAIAESNLNPKARSSAGAVGLMQILPSTFAEIRSRNPGFKDIRQPRWNVAAGIYYDRQLYREWAEQVAVQERLAFTFGSYNAGLGGMRGVARKAARAGRDAGRWAEVAPFARGQTRQYVRRIRRLMGRDPI